MVGHISKLSRNNLYTRVGLPGSVPQQTWGAVARPPVLTPVPVQAIHSSPPIGRRFQTGVNREKLAHMLNSLVCVSSWAKIVRNIAHMLDSFVRVPRDTPEKLAFMLDSTVRVSQQ